MPSALIETVTLGNAAKTTASSSGEEVTTFFANRFWQGASETSGKRDSDVAPEEEVVSRRIESP